MKIFFSIFILLPSFLYAQPSKNMKNNAADTVKNDPFLQNLLQQHINEFNDILKNKTEWNVQVIYSQINRKTSNEVELIHHYFNVDEKRYFYPASTVKLPIALMALQRLNELQIDKNTTMITEAAHEEQTAVYNDPTEAFGKPNIAHYIKKILMVSDNDAYNRLYEFLGQDYINNELYKKGYKNAQILHRLNISLTADENRVTNPVKFLSSSGQIVYEQSLKKATKIYPLRNDFIGKSYYANEKLINEPMDFSKKNRIGLEELHQILISLVFPNKVPANQRFNITETDRQFVLKYMSQYPGESVYPDHDTANYQDAYCKFLLFGAEKKPLPKNMRIFNKVGDAYGHMLDVAYIVDFDKQIEFFLSAVIYCNSDGVLNDDKYDYDTIGLPFMKNLGKVIYDYEIKRERKAKADLSEFKFDYDK